MRQRSAVVIMVPLALSLVTASTALATTTRTDAPTRVSAVSPDHGDVSGRRGVVLRGRFQHVRKVLFGSKAAPSWQYSDATGQHVNQNPGRLHHYLAVTAPQHRRGAVRVQVVTDEGRSNHNLTSADRFTYRDDGNPQITTSGLPGATEGVDYWGALTTADDRSGTWRITAGSLPDGLHITDNDVLNGVPSTVETAHFTLAFTDGRGRTAHIRRSIRVAPGHWSVSPSLEYQIACGATTCYRSNAADMIEARTSATGSWAPASLQDPGELHDAYTTHIACSPDSSTTCALTAIDPGDDDEGTFYRMQLAATDASGSWVPSEAPAPDGVHGQIRLNAVTCESDECIAVGEGNLGNQPDAAGYYGLPVIETYRNGSWTARTLPGMQQRGVLATHLSVVGCEPGGDFCFAQGSAVVANGTDVKTIEFGVDVPPTGDLLTFGSDGADFGVPGDQIHTDAVGCASATSCTVLGHYGHRRTPFYLSISNLRIRPHAFDPPPDVRSSHLHFASLACGSGACFAIGSVRVHGQLQSVVAHIVGSDENSYRTPDPRQAADAVALQSIACGSDGDCIAGASWTYEADGGKRALGVARLGTDAAVIEQAAEDPSTNAPFGTGEAQFGQLSCGDWCLGISHFGEGHYVQVTPDQ